MKQIKAHIAVSLDGYIATLDNELEWLPNEVKKYISQKHTKADSLLMGVNTYQYIFEHWGGWPYGNKTTFVVSHHDTNVTPNHSVKFLVHDQLEKIFQLKQESCMLVVGGGILINHLIKAKLIDNMTLYIVPKLLGSGIKLFEGESNSDFRLMKVNLLSNNIVCLNYSLHY